MKKVSSTQAIKWKSVFSLMIIVLTAMNLSGQCLQIDHVSVGACTNVSGSSQVLVAVLVSGSTTNDITISDGNGNSGVINIGPTGNGTPNYVQFIVPASGGTFVATASSSGCTTVSQSYTLPVACPLEPNCDAGLFNDRVGGRVWIDYDVDGIQGASEYGVMDLTVRLFDAANNVVATVMTDVNGDWTAAGLNSGQPYRIEYDQSTVPSPIQLGRIGSNTESTVQFVTAPSCGNNLGLYILDDYVENDPRVIAPRWRSGDPTSGGTSYNVAAIVASLYSESGNGYYGYLDLFVPAERSVALLSEVGTVWGLAWNKYDLKVYSSAFLRRHAGLGPNGLGAIYVSTQATPPTGNWSTTLLVDLIGQGLNLGQAQMNLAGRGLPGTHGTPSHDSEAFAQIGKIGLGDIDIDGLGNTLYAVNLFGKSLVKMPLNGAGTGVTGVTEYTIPNPAMVSADWRPFAVKVYKGKVYVGGVDSRAASPDFPNDDYQNLRAYVFEFDPVTNTFNTTPILEVPLGYDHETEASNVNVGNRWVVWEDDYTKHVTMNSTDYGDTYNFDQPIFSDIEFTSRGDMILGFADRGAMQWGDYNYSPDPLDGGFYKTIASGEILRAYKNEEGYFLSEKDGVVGYSTGCDVTAGGGPGGDEFYCGDNSSFHRDNSLGGVAAHPSFDEIVIGYLDPVVTISGGLGYLKNSDGSYVKGMELYRGDGASPDAGFMGKGGGMGDVELLSTAVPPLQIGNRVWLDTDGDGIQDADEAGIDGVNVQIYDASGTTLLGSFTTVAGGKYAFGGNVSPNGLVPNTTYVLRIDPSQYSGGTGSGPLATYFLTDTDSDPTTDGDIRDNDASETTGTADIVVTTGPAGTFIHTYDFGFTAVVNNCPVTNGTVTDVTGEGVTTMDVGGGDMTTGFCAEAIESRPEVSDVYSTISDPSTINFSNGSLTNAQILDSVGRVLALLLHPDYAPSPLPTDLNDDFYLAIQLAVWQYTDGFSPAGPTYPGWTGADGNPYDVRDIFTWIRNGSLNPVKIIWMSPPSGAAKQMEVMIDPCPSCYVGQSSFITCNDNGTAGNSSDDWFSLDVTGTVTDGSGNYVVKIGGYTSAVTASGSTVTIVGDGQGGNPSLMADGFSTYTVRVEDELDNTCFTEFTVGPVSPCSNCRATATRSSILCDNNGTPADSLDDWYSIDIAGTINGGSGSYVVKVGGYTSGVTASGSTITLVGDGQGGNPMLPADGVTTVVFRIEDALDSDCYTTMSVQPISPCSFCPAYNCSSVTTSKD